MKHIDFYLIILCNRLVFSFDVDSSVNDTESNQKRLKACLHEVGRAR